MYYYKKNIGDYRSATAHLTLLEHGVYNWLLDTYYINEQPLPLDERVLFRMALSRTEDEKQAVRDILGEFFTQTEAGWIHKRCDEEIAAYQAKADANRSNGGKGGRPSKNKTQDDQQPNPSENPQETQSVISGNPQETLTINQEPLTNNHNTNTQNNASEEKIENGDLNYPAFPINTDSRYTNFEGLGFKSLPDDWRVLALERYPELNEQSLRDLWLGFSDHWTPMFGKTQAIARWKGDWGKWLANGAQMKINHQGKAKPQDTPAAPEKPSKPVQNVDRFHNPSAVPPPADLMARLKGGVFS